MKKYTLKKTTIATQGPIYIGIDAHKDSLHFTVLGPDRNEPPLLVHTSPNGRNHLEALIKRFAGCEIWAVYEAGLTGYRLKHWLEELGCEAFMTPPSQVLQIRGGKQIKTDARDSLALAEQLRNQQLNPVHDLGEQGYRRRELTRTREQLRNHRISICSQIKAKLTYHHILVPEEISEQWSKPFLQWLEGAPTGDRELDLCIAELTGLYRELTRRMEKLEREIAQLAQTQEYSEDVELLCSVPGIGQLTAMILLLELGDISRFERSEEFASFLGLIPGEWSSGETQRKQGLMRWGNKRARTALVQSSWQLIRKDERMGKIYERLKFKKNSGTAICAVARRLGLAIRAMLRDRQPYRLE